MTRRASCGCGQLSVTCEGEPFRISMCHCLACQQRTGSVFGVQARFGRGQISAIEGVATAYTRPADSGNSVTFHFCATCGTTVYWQLSAFPEVTVVAVGAFADPGFPEPGHSVFEASRHGWAMTAAGLDMEHLD